MIQHWACWHPSREERRLNSNQNSSIHLFCLATAVRDPCHQKDISGKGQPAAELPILTASEIIILELFLISPAAPSQWPFQHVPLQGWVSGRLPHAGTASLLPSALLHGCINHGHHPAGQRMPTRWPQGALWLTDRCLLWSSSRANNTRLLRALCCCCLNTCQDRDPVARDLHHHLRFRLPKLWQSPDARARDC